MWITWTFPTLNFDIFHLNFLNGCGCHSLCYVYIILFNYRVFHICFCYKITYKMKDKWFVILSFFNHHYYLELWLERVKRNVTWKFYMFVKDLALIIDRITECHTSNTFKTCWKVDYQRLKYVTYHNIQIYDHLTLKCSMANTVILTKGVLKKFNVIL